MRERKKNVRRHASGPEDGGRPAASGGRRKPCGLHCIKIQHLSVTIGEQEILRDINLHIHCGSLNALIGKNGAGKSTLMRAILGDVPHSGQIEFKNTEDGRMQRLRVGYVPQSLNVDKYTPVSVYDMIACCQSRLPVFLKKSRKLAARIREYLEIFQAEELLDKQVCNLSGGELQRVLLSMAVMDEPNLLLLDEPVSGIDQNGMEVFYQAIHRLKEEFDLAIILISHDLSYVAEYADRVILLDREVLKQGTVEEVYASAEFQRVFGTGALIGDAGKTAGALIGDADKAVGSLTGDGARRGGQQAEGGGQR